MFDELVEVMFPGAGWLAIGLAIGTAFSEQLRPVAKEAIKIGMTVGERVQEATAEAYERGQDLVAEARAERVTGNGATGPARRPRRTARPRAAE